jgi:hypothetical protein
MRSLGLFLLTASVLAAQTFNARITGSIKDSTGSVIPQAKITATNAGTNVAKSATSGETGDYNIPLLLPGVYSVQVEAPGMATQVRNDVRLETNATVTLDFSLTVASTDTKIDVTAEVPLLQSETSGVGTTLENKLISQFPLVQRDVMGLVRSLPGIIAASQVGDARGGRNVFNSNFSVGGGRTSTNEVLLDGAPNTIGDFNGVAIVPPQDSVQELRVETSSYSAEFGRTGGGTVNIVTKSGTNEYHGGVFYYHQNDAFNANSFTNNRNRVARPIVRRHQYGMTFGGPVWIPKLYQGKNKTFFFTAYEGRRDSDPTQGLFSVPTPRENSGDFSQTFFVRAGSNAGELVRIFDPLTSRVVNGQRTRDAFPNNIIPADRINRIARNVLARYPQANLPGDPITNRRNLFFNGKNEFTRDVFSTRIDHFFNEKHRIFGRFNWQENLQIFPNSAVRIPDNGNVYDQFRNIGLDDTYTFSPNLSNVFRISYARFFANQQPRGEFPFDATSLGLPSYIRDQANIPILPNFSFGFADFGGRAFNRQPRDTPAIQNNLVWNKGRHNIRLGGEYRIYKFYPFQVFNPTGSFSFGSAFTQRDHLAAAQPGEGLGLASLLLGAGSFSYEVVEPLTAFSHYVAGYAQDDWRVSSKLTLNFGLRWETETGTAESHNRLTYLDPTFRTNLPGNPQGAIFFAGNTKPRSIRQANLNNWQPRIGFAYRVNSKTVARGGYGIFFLPLGLEPGIVTTPFNFTAIADTINPDFSPRRTLSDPFPGGVPRPATAARVEDGTFLLGNFPSAGTVIRDINAGYIQQWNFAVQRQIARTTTVDATYFGSRGVHLPVPSMQLNQIDSRYLQQGGAFLTQLVDNPFFGQFSSGLLSARQVPRIQLLKPFPQFASPNAGLPGAYSGTVLINRPPVGDSTYHALTVRFERRYSQGLSISAHYTFSKLIDIGGVGNGNAFNDPSAFRDIYNIRLERAVSVWDVPQRMIATYSYELPLGKGKKWLNSSALLDRFIGGWTIFGFHTYESGRPVVIGGPDLSRLAGASPSRASVVAGIDPRIDYSQAVANARNFSPACNCTPPWFNTAAFSTTPEFVIPNGPRNMPNLRQDWTRNVDAVVSKKFAVTEKVAGVLEFRAYQVFNNVWFAGPNGTVNSNTFGSVTAVNSAPRRLELGAKINF